MAEQHPIWRGHLRLALVSCPIALYAARHAANELHFHYINPKTGNRVRMITLDAGTDKEVTRSELVKGYEFKKDTYVLMDDEDFERAKIDSSSVLNVAKFVPGGEIDPVYYDNSYYMVPDGEAGQDVYVVLRDAIAKTGRTALSRLVIARRERAVAILPMGRGLVLHTLHEERDLYSAATRFKDVPDLTSDPDMVALATQLIDRQTGKFDPADMEDRYEARLREVIESKLRGEAVAAEPEDDDDGGNVIDLMAALKRSLGQTVKKETAKPGGAKKASSPARAKAKVAPGKNNTYTAAGKPAPAKKRA